MAVFFTSIIPPVQARAVCDRAPAVAADAASQESVEQAVQRLSEAIASFGEGLAELRAEQDLLGPVLQQLAGPLELRLVPGQRAEGGASAD